MNSFVEVLSHFTNFRSLRDFQYASNEIKAATCLWPFQMKPVSSARADGRVRVATFDVLCFSCRYLRCTMFFVLAINGTVASFIKFLPRTIRSSERTGYLAGEHAAQLGKTEVRVFFGIYEVLLTHGTQPPDLSGVERSRTLHPENTHDANDATNSSSARSIRTSHVQCTPRLWNIDRILRNAPQRGDA